jgi:hypothetical protein
LKSQQPLNATQQRFSKLRAFHQPYFLQQASTKKEYAIKTSTWQTFRQAAHITRGGLIVAIGEGCEGFRAYFCGGGKPGPCSTTNRVNQ